MADISFVRAVAYFITSAFGKLPLVYLLMLLWSGVIVGLQGQAIMFLIYSVTMMIAFGIVRPTLASTTTPGSLPFMYSLLLKDTSLVNQFISVFMGIPSESLSAITSAVHGKLSWIHRYLLLGLPDAMIFPSSFMYGYGITSAENGMSDSRNMPALFMTILGILLQINITQMGGIAVFLNVLLGMFIGILGGSFIADNPDLGPFTSRNQSFNMVVTNVN